MTFRLSEIAVVAALSAVSVLAPGAARAQNQQPAPQTPAAQSPAPPPPATQTPAPRSSAPDYPDPRGFSVGITGWASMAGPEPNLYGGKISPDYATLTNLGKPKMTLGAEISFPITRTGTLHAEYFRTQGDGNQTLKRDSDLFANQFFNGDYLATQYKISHVKFYLDDLLYPHKFPVARFRLKSLWEVQYVQIKSSIDAPLAATTDSEGNPISTTGQGSRQITLPTFGLAAEYEIAPHVLLRGDASGFGLHHHSEIWDAEGFVSVRRGHLELLAGAKTFHFKTSPNNTEYLSATVAGPFVSIRWHLY